MILNHFMQRPKQESAVPAWFKQVSTKPENAGRREQINKIKTGW